MRRRLVIAFLLLGLWVAGGSEQIARGQSLTKGRAVVVLVGIAGDVESEKAYADQLGHLLDELASPGVAPGSLTLLVENLAASDRKFLFPVKVLSDRRESLLSLRGSNPDLVIVWGHGGQQGTQPVLHVPGPRVTPSDLLAPVAPESAKPSDWVLYFRGSQAFAQALSSPTRRVLASEGEKSFTYDPVGFPLLLDAFPRAPDLPALAAGTARAVEQWYGSRSLAATEQATLWVDGHPAPASPANVAPAVVAGGAEAGQTASSWHGPPAVDPAAYSDADAVILRESVQAVIGDNPQLSQEEERYVQILSPEGKRFGDLDLAFSPPEENLTVIDCEIRQPDGGVDVGTRSGPEFLVSADQSGPDDRHLVREMPVQPGPRDPGVLGDLAHRRATDTRDAQASFGGVEQPLSSA